MLAAIPIASELKTIYFSTGEATEATGAKGTRFSFRTGTDTYSIAAASLPWCVENFGKKWTIIYADYAWGQSTNQEFKHYIEKSGGKVCSSIPIPLDAKDFVPYLSQIPVIPRCCCRPSSGRCRSPSTPRPRRWASTRK